MPTSRFVFALAFLALPAAEIAGFILVGSRIGVLATLALLVLAGVVGVALLRWQGTGVVGRIRAETDAGRVPGRALLDGALIVAAAVFLIIPGFITDIAGLLLFLPPVRALLVGMLVGRLRVHVVGAEQPTAGARAVELEPGEWRREDERRGPSYPVAPP